MDDFGIDQEGPGHVETIGPWQQGDGAITRQLTPLNPIRVFEAAGRHLSLSKAAQELNVTQSAVSRQVKLLENILGIALFERTPRSVKLTTKGKQYLEDIGDAFAILEDATNRVRERNTPDIIKLRVYSTFALRWLIPRLPRFAQCHPKIEVQLMTLSPASKMDFEHELIDAYIRTGFGDWAGVRSDRLIQNHLVAVCHPDIAARLKTPSDLKHVTLLHSYARQDDWRKWINALKLEGIDPVKGMKFENSGLAYQAAASGLGVAISQVALVQAELRQGTLVIPFPYSLPAERTYYFVSPLGHNSRRVQVFRDWLISECDQDENFLESLGLKAF
ncbi:transcriptional regulator GcvA [Shinella sp.]|uniref:transcriptional regulator GcvA n=1 Tax=Shinella sp. TaxID=1870904 RepID=UPI00301C42D0